MGALLPVDLDDAQRVVRLPALDEGPRAHVLRQGSEIRRAEKLTRLDRLQGVLQRAEELALVRFDRRLETWEDAVAAVALIEVDGVVRIGGQVPNPLVDLRRTESLVVDCYHPREVDRQWTERLVDEKNEPVAQDVPHGELARRSRSHWRTSASR